MFIKMTHLLIAFFGDFLKLLVNDLILVDVFGVYKAALILSFDCHFAQSECLLTSTN